MLTDEIVAPGKPVRHWEVAFGKARSAALEQVEIKGSPWFLGRDCRLVDGIWYAELYGSFNFSSDSEVVSQKGILARVALRAKDGKVLECKVERRPRNPRSRR